MLVDARFLDLLQPDTILVNTARATLVDEPALADALRGGGLADRTLFTPHAAAQPVEAVDQMGLGAVDALLALLRGEQPPNLVRPPDRDGT